MPNTTLTHSLAGAWDFRFDDEPEWRRIDVPGCWETPDGPKDSAGPAWYRTQITIPAEAEGRRVALAFGAVSYVCTVFIDGKLVGEHTGLWDAFTIDLTNAVQPGTRAELSIQVEKPAALTAGPDSTLLPGRFPLRTTLSGFLPYVWGQIFGGIWQDVTLIVAGPPTLDDLFVRGSQDGQVTVELGAGGPPTSLTIEITDPEGALVVTEIIAASDPRWSPSASADRRECTLQYTLPAPRPWSPADPARYSLVAHLDSGDEQRAVFGLRTIQIDGSDLFLNGQPLYPRMALSWGWYADLLHCNPDPERVRIEMTELRSLGYNGIKLCLWFPPEHYFTIADQLGMLLWVELPMWLTQPDEGFRQRVLKEYDRLVRQARKHPSVILYTLGCELNRAIGPEILKPLYEHVKYLVGDAPVRDNSGSGVAYGGLLNEYADFDDYHFYCDLQHFRPLVESFAPRWRPKRPWLFGEYCDYDTLRDPAQVAGAWWMSEDSQINPQGARWQFDAPFLGERMRQNGIWERRAELQQLSNQHALLHRKWTIEATRAFSEVTGYVITGLVDTPISTAGMWEDRGILKFKPDAARAFNADLVALVGWDQRRDWVNGGDRTVFSDSWSYRSGALVRPHLIASHYGRSQGVARAAWHVAFDDSEKIDAGIIDGPLFRPGQLGELGVAEFTAPAVTRPRSATLTVTVSVGAEQNTNTWPLWFYPAIPRAWGNGISLDDPRGLLAGIERLITIADSGSFMSNEATIATGWSSELQHYVEQGGAALLIEPGDTQAGPLPMTSVPFWRECIRIVEPHPGWGNFPHSGWAGLQMLCCATDRALDHRAWAGDVTPLLLRVDTRTAATHSYIAELQLGRGRIIITTLRLWGGHGDQPSGIGRSPAALHLLSCLVDSLRKDSEN